MQSGCLQDHLRLETGHRCEHFAKQLSERFFPTRNTSARYLRTSGWPARPAGQRPPRVANLSAFPAPPRPLRRRLHPGGVCLCDVTCSKQSPPPGCLRPPRFPRRGASPLKRTIEAPGARAAAGPPRLTALDARAPVCK